MNSGRRSERKCSGRWRLREAVLSDSACTPEASKVSHRGPPPSVVLRQRSGSSLRGVAPWPFRRRIFFRTLSWPGCREARCGTSTVWSSTSAFRRTPSSRYESKRWSGYSASAKRRKSTLRCVSRGAL
eukprot:2237813-Pleurochrysis_carterae.AAC.1